MVIAEPVDNQIVILEPNGRLTAETVDEFNADRVEVGPPTAATT